METQGIIIAHPKTEEEANALKVVMKALKIRFEISKEDPYDPLFVARTLTNNFKPEDYNKITYIPAFSEIFFLFIIF